jgi:protein-S-isoprenylcysteine O-methyltransferase Ste14
MIYHSVFNLLRTVQCGTLGEDVFGGMFMTNQTKLATSVAVAVVAIAVLFSPLSSLLSHTTWSIVAVVLALVIVGAALSAMGVAVNEMDARHKAKEEKELQ